MFHDQNRKLGSFLVLLAAIGFAGKTILTKLVYRYGLDPLTLLTIRVVMAGAFFGAILVVNLARRRWTLDLTKKEWALVFLMGGGGYYVSSYLDFLGLFYVDANLGRMILFLYPTLVVAIDSFISKVPVSRPTKASLAICYFGLFLMMAPNLGRPQANFLLGVAYVFLSALLYAFYLVGVDRFFQGRSINFFVSLMFATASLCVFAHFLAVKPLSALAQPLGAYWLILLMASFSTVVPIYALSSGLAMIGAPRAATLSMIGPAATLFMGVFVLGETIMPIQFLGTALMILGVARIK
ncbi:MAG: DMT family transporter [Deltaproteobacteria bacterium]|jgi:drug/metabolite transporter (DMT)-like permease|nr:DMT family transporter [Deltaproteobacteria bacterium]